MADVPPPRSAALTSIRKGIDRLRARWKQHAYFGLDAFAEGWPTLLGGLKLAGFIIASVAGTAYAVLVADAAPWAVAVVLALVLAAVVAGGSRIHGRATDELQTKLHELAALGDELAEVRRESAFRLELRDLAQAVADSIEPLRSRCNNNRDYDLTSDSHWFNQIATGVASRLREEGFPCSVADEFGSPTEDPESDPVVLLNAMTNWVGKLQTFARDPHSFQQRTQPHAQKVAI